MTPNELENKREFLGWTKRELAKRLGITERCIYNYINGKKIPKTVELLFDLLYKKYGGK